MHENSGATVRTAILYSWEMLHGRCAAGLQHNFMVCIMLKIKDYLYIRRIINHA